MNRATRQNERLYEDPFEKQQRESIAAVENRIESRLKDYMENQRWWSGKLCFMQSIHRITCFIYSFFSLVFNCISLYKVVSNCSCENLRKKRSSAIFIAIVVISSLVIGFIYTVIAAFFTETLSYQYVFYFLPIAQLITYLTFNSLQTKCKNCYPVDSNYNRTLSFLRTTNFLSLVNYLSFVMFDNIGRISNSMRGRISDIC